mmetsp:Transcript_38681/g.110684  ORF Transcript_38681/g.110684 Transcript_38681/m.110684 type:complete len:235 (+) Transcript_38681:306-1010(+)
MTSPALEMGPDSPRFPGMSPAPAAPGQGASSEVLEAAHGLPARDGGRDLVDPVQAGPLLRHQDPDDREHRESAVVELAVAELVVEAHAAEGGGPARRVAEVAGRPGVALRPELQLVEPRRQEEDAEGLGGRRLLQGRQAGGGLRADPRELVAVGRGEADGRHHGHAGVLDLGGAVLAEGGLVRAQARRVPEAQRRERPDLLRRVERAVPEGLVARGQAGGGLPLPEHAHTCGGA